MITAIAINGILSAVVFAVVAGLILRSARRRAVPAIAYIRGARGGHTDPARQVPGA